MSSPSVGALEEKCWSVRAESTSKREAEMHDTEDLDRSDIGPRQLWEDPTGLAGDAVSAGGCACGAVDVCPIA